MIINCSLKNAKEVEPRHVNYTWSSCDNDNCNDKANWRLKLKSYSLKLNSQTREMMKYQCTAKNAAGQDSKVIKIVDQGNTLRMSACVLNHKWIIYGFSSTQKLSCAQIYTVKELL